MSITAPSRAFVADTAGSIAIVGGGEPQTFDLGATQPIDVPMAGYLTDPTTND
jgi:hypothetical protein